MTLLQPLELGFLLLRLWYALADEFEIFFVEALVFFALPPSLLLFLCSARGFSFVVFIFVVIGNEAFTGL
jgi:hypothetical protein